MSEAKQERLSEEARDVLEDKYELMMVLVDEHRADAGMCVRGKNGPEIILKFYHEELGTTDES